jgi:predicted CoA-binding protein
MSARREEAIMARTKEAAEEFLSTRRVAVTGVSHAPHGHGSNAVYTRLRDRGYAVFAVNPTVPAVEGDHAYPSLRAIPGGVDSVVIATRPDRAMDTMREAVDLGIHHVWMHRAFGKGSVSHEAATYGREHGVTVIEGGCPLMYGDAADGGHKVMCSLLKLTGNVPRTVP